MLEILPEGLGGMASLPSFKYICIEEVNISNGHELIEKDDIPNLQR
jgi:hypothetical protein